MIFGKKKSVVEESPKSSVLEVRDRPRGFVRAPTPPPPVASPPLPPPPVRESDDPLLRESIEVFQQEYDGMILHGTDQLRSSLLFALFVEQRRTNQLLLELLERGGEE